MEHIAKLVCFGLGGDSVEFGGGCRSSGYGTPDRPHAAAGCVIPDGTPVIDKRPAVETTEGYKWVFRGPMVNVDLPDGDIAECPQPSDIMAAAMTDGGNDFGKLLALQVAYKATEKKAGPLDFVSIREYIAGWRAVGARIGQYAGGQIVWE